jgi:TonB-dependent receptor
VRFDVPAYLDALHALDGQPILDENGDPTGEVFDADRTLPELNPVQSYDVQEDTNAVFVRADFGADRWYANVGLRWVDTDTTARTAVNTIVRVVDPTPNIPTSSPDVTYSEADPLTQKGSYSELLPSFNAGFWLRDDLLLRAAAAKVLARPSLNQLAPTRTDNTLDRTFAVFYDGNADLDPVTATQADLSIEWYFTPKSILNAAVFWKDIEDFITTELLENQDIGVVASIGGGPDAPLLYDVSRPINGDNAKVLGFELGAQHFFPGGVGFRASYTYTDTKATIGGVHVGELEGVSKSAYSIALMYERDRWDAQVAADYSGKYTEVTDAVGGLSQIGAPITWVTASVAYKVSDAIGVSLEGRNLTDAHYFADLGRRDIMAGFETWGRSVILGVNVKF